ncbi:hypothetical protein DPX16_4742 [Anabarilius grahami]|uniref:Uncharacterized protein n=1 Tax=Anabarilius grahami TaxID=495550 RepID=A0A3N0YJF9_ANAGA|nr:hypothetical protein DPX16_4742 [Anabarilius grahami]
MWVDQAKGVLTDNSGTVMRVDILARSAREATLDMWVILSNVTREPNPAPGKVPAVEDILQWQRYTSVLKAEVAKTGRDVPEVSAIRGIQVVAGVPSKTANSKSDCCKHDQCPKPSLVPSPPRNHETGKYNNAVAKAAPTAPMAPISIPLPGHLIPGNQEATARGQIGVYQDLDVTDMWIVSSLPIMKSNSTNTEFWDHLWVTARTHQLAIKELYSVCEIFCPPTHVRQMDKLKPPVQAPTNAEFVNQYKELLCHCSAYCWIWYTNTNTQKGPNESFIEYTERLTNTLEEFVACVSPNLNSPIVLHIAMTTLNSKFAQLFRSSIPAITNWASFLEWGMRAQGVLDQEEKNN